MRHVKGSKTTFVYALERGINLEGNSVCSCTSGIHSSKHGPYTMRKTCAKRVGIILAFFVAGKRTSSVYSKKSPLESQSEHGVNECTTACPEECTLIPPLSVPKIQHGLSPVKNTPVNVFSGAGDVTNGMNNRCIFFSSARTDFSWGCSSGCWISNALDRTFTNFTGRIEGREAGSGSPVGSSKDTAS